MSPLEHPLGWAAVIVSATSPLWLPVVFLVTEKYHTVRRNRRHAEKGYTR